MQETLRHVDLFERNAKQILAVLGGAFLPPYRTNIKQAHTVLRLVRETHQAPGR